MSKKMLIEATHPEETRVVVLDGERLEELDVETSTKKQIKGNIYLAKIVRVEPSLQAAFVEYGGNRHGFLAFNEIRPDYYQIPVADREALKKEMDEALSSQTKDSEIESKKAKAVDVEEVTDSDGDDLLPRPRYNGTRRYRIQEVIHHNQIVLVQVTKEERGNKGAAMTTYLSLAGRYSVLMPNNNHGGGVSRKIANVADRKRLKEILEKLPIPASMSLIIRTAGKERNKTEIKKDFDYLNKTWAEILDKTMKSVAPALIHEEGNLIKRALRDDFTDELDEVLVEGAEAFKTSKAFVKMLMPRQVKKLKEYTGDIPLFQAYKVENQLTQINSKNVHLRSGGYLVIDQTEALVAVDVNSGRATRERNIEETALKTNLEAADEIARQLRLRDLAGLVVIDFIDMDEMRNNHALERRMKEALKKDRARVQVGRISGFGLMEVSRQRMRSSLIETAHSTCPMCQGSGIVRSPQSCSMHILHVLEEAGMTHPNMQINLTLPFSVAFYVLNAKRSSLSQIEERYGIKIQVRGDGAILDPTDFRVEYERLDGVLPTNERMKQPCVKKESFAKVVQEKILGTVLSTKEKTQEDVAKTPALAETGMDRSDRPQRGQNDRRRRRRGGSNHPRVTSNESNDQKSKTEDGFKVVRQEPLVLFDSHRAVEKKADAPVIVAPTTQQKAIVATDTSAAVSATEKPKAIQRPRRRPVNKKSAESVEKKSSTNAAKKDIKETVAVSSLPTEPAKKGWWNKLIN